MLKQKKTIFVLKKLSYSMFFLYIVLFSTQTKQTTVQPDSGFISIFLKVTYINRGLNSPPKQDLFQLYKQALGMHIKITANMFQYANLLFGR